MDKEKFIAEAKKTGLPDYAIQEILEIHEQADRDGNPIPYSLDYDLNIGELSGFYARGCSPDTQTQPTA